jgi:hypothetical protein
MGENPIWQKKTPQINPIDVVVMLSGSFGIPSTYFHKYMLGFVKHFARNLAVSQNGHRLGVVQYGVSPRTEFSLGQYSDNNSVGI